MGLITAYAVAPGRAGTQRCGQSQQARVSKP